MNHEIYKKGDKVKVKADSRYNADTLAVLVKTNFTLTIKESIHGFNNSMYYTEEVSGSWSDEAIIYLLKKEPDMRYQAPIMSTQPYLPGEFFQHFPRLLAAPDPDLPLHQ